MRPFCALLTAPLGTTFRVVPEAAKSAGLKTPVGLVDAVMKAMAVEDDSAPLAVDRKGKPVIVAGWKITERVPLSEDLDEHMEREVLPYAPGAQWDETKAEARHRHPIHPDLLRA